MAFGGIQRTKGLAVSVSRSFEGRLARELDRNPSVGLCGEAFGLELPHSLAQTRTETVRLTRTVYHNVTNVR